MTGIPPQFLNQGDSYELRDQLIQTNVAFATIISDMQECDNRALQKLIDILAELYGKSFIPSKFVKIKLIPPHVLMLQMIEMSLTSVGNIANVFQQIGMKIEPYQFLKQYVPHYDWDKFKDSVDDKEDLDVAKKGIKPDDDMGMGMGM